MLLSKNKLSIQSAYLSGAMLSAELGALSHVLSPRILTRPGIDSHRLYDPNLKPGIPSLRNLVEQKAVAPPQTPSTFPCETLRDETANSHQTRYWDSGAQEHLHSNLPPGVMCFSQEPIPEIISERSLAKYGPNSPFRHRELIREWIEGLLIRGKSHDLIQFNTTVELAEYGPKSAEWTLTLRREQPGKDKDYWWQEKFDALVVASGHFYLPYIPDIPGLLEFDEAFPGRVQHSKHYRSVEDYRDKVRKSTQLFKRSRLTRLFQRVVVVGGSISAFDALHDIRLVAKLPVISCLRKPNAVFTEAAFTHPDLVVKPQIKSFSPDLGRITFSDGSWVDDVDVVLFATGYDFSVPFLPDLKGVNKRIPGLYQHVFKTDNPSLAFIGMASAPP